MRNWNIIAKLSVLLLLSFVTASVVAQTKTAFAIEFKSGVAPECGVDNLLTHLRKDPKYSLKEARMNREILSAQRTLSDDTLTLPVVFHIINEDPQSIPDQKILDALKDLNDAFSKSGAYSSSKGADTKIRFCLAQQDPDGGNTTGITRTKSFFSTNQNPETEDARLKNLIQWDPLQYINIWFITSMNQEEYATFICGQWSRISKHAYATMPPGSGPLDGIVVTQFNYMLAHEMGHYLGLYHTFEGNNCNNNDCTVDGDKVCDTPPNTYFSNTNSCSSPVNTCSTDTLSGFTQDVNDLVDDFMDYGNESCANEFTQGQADRMRAAIETQRPGLLQPKCAKPCNENITANFTRDNANPVTGSLVHFTNTSQGAGNYQWLVNDVVVSSAKNFPYTFTTNGKYKVSLKAYNTISCYASYTDFVIVTCGVTARFYTDKQFLASKTGVFVDSVHFTNTSENASNFQWIVSNNAGMNAQVVSTSKDFIYGLPQPAIYSVQLIASNGNCKDTTAISTITVDDPTADGDVRLHSVSCYQKTKLRIDFFICNSGYATIPANIPVSFYDADPRLGNAHKIGLTFLTTDSVPGHCCGPSYTFIVDARTEDLNQVFVVFNDSGTTIPLHLPNTSLLEKNYDNNIIAASNFQFTVSATPAEAILEPGDTIQLTAQAKPDSVSSYIWSDALNLSCTRCQTTSLIADSNRVKSIIANSNYGCADTAYVIIKVPPANDYTVSIDSVVCSANDSLNVTFTIYNHFKRGVIPKGLSVAFYSGNPVENGVFLKPLFKVAKQVNEKKATFSATIKGISQGSLYAVVNDNGTGVQDTISFPEKDYTNNDTSIVYTPDSVSIQPSDTTVIRKGTVPLSIASAVFNPATTTWFSGTGNSLSCTRCSNTTATVFNNSTVTVQTANKYGCLIKGSANLKIFPPDYTIKMLSAECYTNNTTLVTFQVCVSKDYDSIYSNLPVSFYDNLPNASKANLLYPTFYAQASTPGQCYTFTHKVATPVSGQLFAVVNDKGSNGSVIPDKQFDETDYTNDTSSIKTVPFKITVAPADTTLAQLGNVTLFTTVTGGTVSSYSWDASPSISCTNCAMPVVSPSFTTRYKVLVKNQNSCSDTASALIKVFTSGSVNIPTAFSPNADGLNDIFYVLAGRDVSLIKDFTIYNRWGQKIFQSTNSLPNDPTLGWNGTFAGQQSAPGTYVYVATIAFADGTQQLVKGTVVLVR